MEAEEEAAIARFHASWRLEARHHPHVWRADSRAISCFANACSYGATAKAQWMAEYFGLGTVVKSKELRGAISRSLWEACARGHLETARWLEARFDLGAAGVRAYDVNAAQDTTEWPWLYDGSPILHKVCVRGHFDVAEWLVRVGCYDLEEVQALVPARYRAELVGRMEAAEPALGPKSAAFGV